MKRTLLTLSIVLLAVAAQAQIKLHSNGRLTFQTVANTTTQGVSIGPAPDWSVDFNGPAYFHKSGLFVKNAAEYEWLNAALAPNPHSVAWVVANPNWDTTKFYVYGKGDAYARRFITFSQDSSNAKGSEAIDGEEALSIISRINGYYFPPEELEIPDLENNEFVNPEAVEAMYADFAKRTAELSASELSNIFPDAVRTDHQNRLCIDYQSVVTMLVEAVKEQQRVIEAMRAVLEANGLMEPEKP